MQPEILDFDSFDSWYINRRTHELLEDFEIIATPQHMALVPRDIFSKTLRVNVHAAVFATSFDLSSLDHVKKHYFSNNKEHKSISSRNAYITTYHFAKDYISRLLKKLQTEGRPEPTFGIFGASVALTKLPYSLFCAHLLFQLGHEYEGYTVARLILEQIAWAYTVYELNDLESIIKVGTTRTITHFKHLAPSVGMLYGFLSKKTHIDFSRHGEFLRIIEGKNVILHTQQNFLEYGKLILYLADLFGVVWELSQLPYINKPETIIISKKGPIPNPKRPFIKVMNKCINAIEKTLPKTEKTEGDQNKKSRKRKK